MDILRLSSSLKDLKSFNLWQSLFAELLGTFLLAFIGFGSVYSNMNPVKVGLGFGLAGAVIIYCIGPVSGGNINPAVSFGLLIARQISLIRFILYFFVQIIGATSGYKFISILTSGKLLSKSVLTMNISNLIKTLNNTSILTMNMTNLIKALNKPPSILTVNMKNLIDTLNNKTFSDAFIITEKIDRIDDKALRTLCEMVIAFVLVFTVMRLCVEKSRSATEKGLAPLIIGISITIGVYCGMNISGGSMNPAVSLGKYLCTGSKGITSHIIGPLIGGFLAGILQQLVFTSNLSLEHIKSYLFCNDFNDELSNNERQDDIQLNDRTNTGRYSPNIKHVQNSPQ